MVRVFVNFRQGNGTTLTKAVELCVIPPPGSWFQYEEGWSLAYVPIPGRDQVRPMEVYVYRDTVGITLFGKQFSAGEAAALEELGWGGGR